MKREWQRIFRAMRTPCDGCPFFTVCANSEMSCGVFDHWIHHSNSSRFGRVPSRAWYQATFCKSDEETSSERCRLLKQAKNQGIKKAA